MSRAATSDVPRHTEAGDRAHDLRVTVGEILTALNALNGRPEGDDSSRLLIQGLNKSSLVGIYTLPADTFQVCTRGTTAPTFQRQSTTGIQTGRFPFEPATSATGGAAVKMRARHLSLFAGCGSLSHVAMNGGERQRSTH